MKTKLLLLFLIVCLLPLTSPAPVRAAEKPLMMAYIHAKTNYSELVASTNGALDEIAVDWLGVNAQGQLLIDEKKYNPDFIKEMHSQGIRVTPMLSNAFNREMGITALNNAEALTTQIAEMVYSRDFDGISYDFENVSENERDLQTAFIKLLRQKMPDKVISVAVAANPSGWSKGWHASYNMKSLAEYADYLMLMAYDEGYSGGPEKPVASISWVEKCIQDLLNRETPAEKIVLGIPLYGRMWSADGTQLGLGVELVQANRMLSDPLLSEKVSTYDETAQTAKLTFTASAAYPLYTWKNIPAGKYTLYYENERSLQQKISLMYKYGLKGLGFWSLGQSDAAIWNVLVPYSEGRFYNDINGHWAEAPICYSISSGWMRWVNESNFSPEQQVYRDQVAAALAGFFRLSTVDAADTWSFADISSGHWAWTSVQAVVYQGMMGGMDAARSTFGPAEVFTRAQFASIFDRLLTAAENEAGREIDWTQLTNPYSDLAEEHWARIPLLRMVERGLLAGYNSDGEQLMKPDAPINRAELAVMLQRMESWFNIDASGWRVELK